MSDADVDIDTLGIKALKELITSAGLSTEDCIDKSDLRARAREAQAAAKSKPAAPPAAPPSGGAGGGRTLGGYSCIVKGPPELLWRAKRRSRRPRTRILGASRAGLRCAKRPESGLGFF